VERINDELARLERKEEATEEQLLAYRHQLERKVDESLAKLVHLQKIHKLLHSKGVEIEKKNLSSMEELEEEEQKEAEEKA
jgi:hypothetical protein